MTCLICNRTIADFSRKQAKYCMFCETYWQKKTSPILAGFQVWEETPSGRKKNKRVWWQGDQECEKGWFQGGQCYRCQTRMSYAQHASYHPSGALKRPGEYGRVFIWFPNCQHCTAGSTFIRYSYTGTSSISETRQCQECLNRYIQWNKERGYIRYNIYRPNYPVKLKIDKSKSLERSAGRIFYHEVDYTQHEGARVEVYAYHPLTHEKELIRINEKYAHYFSSLEEAQEWIYTQMGSSLRTYWL